MMIKGSCCSRIGMMGVCVLASAAAMSGSAMADGLEATYARENGKLFRTDSTGTFRVDETMVSVRFLPGVDTFEKFQAQITSAGPVEEALSSLKVLRSNSLGIYDLEIGKRQNVLAVRDAIAATGLVRWVEETTIGVYDGGGWFPSDPQFDNQYALHNTGQTGGSTDSDMNAPEAWAMQRGDSSIIVAVLDSGTEVSHSDLSPNTWINTDEIPGNGTDDDNNGYVDDVEGWDFNNNNNNVEGPYFHGTHVTGIINAKTQNGQGMAGMAGGWGLDRGCLTMACGVGDFGPNGSILDDAILYAAENGARIITLSLSVGESNAINDAVAHVYDNLGVYIDCAAGNNGSSVGYPARLSRIVAVGATNHNDSPAGFTNPGPEVEVSAPGVDILSTQPGNSYGLSSGTSFSAPYVAALAALILSEADCVTNEELREIMIASSEDVHSSGWDNRTGWGRIDAEAALLLVQAEYSCTLDCIGDLNGDETVDVNDLLGLLAAWGTDDEDADLDGSGSVDVNDLLSLLSVWGTCTV